MKTINLHEYTEFGKVCDIWNNSISDKNGLCEFVTNVIMNMNPFDEKNNNGYGIMLPDLSNIYTLVSKSCFPFEKLNSTNKNTIDMSVAKQNYVLGYIWLCPWNVEKEGYIPCHFINYIDSRISGLNIAKYMMDEYESADEEHYLFPYEIGLSADKYWKKHFMNVYNIECKAQLLVVMSEYGLIESDLKWENVFETIK